ncbi:MAG: MBL fold metallo-hydrolase [Desulfovibrionales bacterium]|nr:MBL fold metallo-hydrolase [Desulfovibrionales bacterium]
MQITALIENTRPENRLELEVESGLSLHIQLEDSQLLFDTGKSGAFADNARALGVDLKAIDTCVISHRHYDHFNGLERFLPLNQQATVYLRNAVVQEYYFKAFFSKRDIGIHARLFDEYPDRFTFVDGKAEIAPSVFLLTDICTSYPRPAGNKYLYVKDTQGLRRDDFAHELIMVVKEDDGLILFSGCAHSGIVNMVETVVQAFPDTPIKGVVGGFHLVGLSALKTMGGSQQDIERIGEQLLSYPIGKLYTGHCTGLKAYEILRSVMGEKLGYLATGESVTL